MQFEDNFGSNLPEDSGAKSNLVSTEVGSPEKIAEYKNQLSGRSITVYRQFTSMHSDYNSTINDQILSATKMSNFDEDLSKRVTELTNEVRSLEAASVSGGGRKSFLQKILPFLSKSKDALLSNIQSSKERLDAYSKEVLEVRDGLLKSAAILEQLGTNAVNKYNDLGIRVEAAQQHYDELVVELNSAIDKARGSGDALDINEATKLQDYLDTVNRGIITMTGERHHLITKVQQITIMVKKNSDEADDLSNVVTLAVNTIRDEFSQNALIQQLERAAQISKGSRDLVQDLIRRNADSVKRTSALIDEQSGRALLDVDTLKYARERTAEAIEASNKKHAERRIERTQQLEALNRLKENTHLKSISPSDKIN